MWLINKLASLATMVMHKRGNIMVHETVIVGIDHLSHSARNSVFDLTSLSSLVNTTVRSLTLLRTSAAKGVGHKW